VAIYYLNTDPFNDGSLLHSWHFENTYSDIQATAPLLARTGSYTLYAAGETGLALDHAGGADSVLENWSTDALLPFADYQSITLSLQHIFLGGSTNWQGGVIAIGNVDTRYNVQIAFQYGGAGLTRIDVATHNGGLSAGPYYVSSSAFHKFDYEYDGGTGNHYLYIDETAHLIGNLPMKWDTRQPLLWIGRNSIGNLSNLIARWDNIFLFDRVLSASERLALADITLQDPSVTVNATPADLTFTAPISIPKQDASVVVTATDLSITPLDPAVGSYQTIDAGPTDLLFTVHQALDNIARPDTAVFSLSSPMLGVMEPTVWPDTVVLQIDQMPVSVPDITLAINDYIGWPLMFEVPAHKVVADPDVISFAVLPISMVSAIHSNYTHLRFYMPPPEVIIDFTTDNTRTDLNITALGTA